MDNSPIEKFDIDLDQYKELTKTVREFESSPIKTKNEFDDSYAEETKFMRNTNIQNIIFTAERINNFINKIKSVEQYNTKFVPILKIRSYKYGYKDHWGTYPIPEGLLETHAFKKVKNGYIKATRDDIKMMNTRADYDPTNFYYKLSFGGKSRRRRPNQNSLRRSNQRHPRKSRRQYRAKTRRR